MEQISRLDCRQPPVLVQQRESTPEVPEVCFGLEVFQLHHAEDVEQHFGRRVSGKSTTDNLKNGKRTALQF